MEIDLLDLLPRGHDHAITGEKLARALNTETRTITQLIQIARAEGAPICASCGDPPGYFLTDDPDELERYLKSLDRRLRNVRKTREACAETLEHMTGQTGMEGF